MTKVGLLVLSVFFVSVNAFSWGGRGHHAICEAAVFLVKTDLKNYLNNKPHVMGHLCNVPDIYWKTLPSEVRKLGDAAHYINAEVLGVKISEVPLEYKKIIEKYTGQPKKEDPTEKLQYIPEDLGSNWWRADQFFRLAIENGKKLKDLPPPSGYKEEQNEELPFNKAFYQMIVNLGLMGHFVGDNSQPFHNTTDYDGYAQNHGGIHAYYEDSSVAQFGPDLVFRIVKRAKEFKKPAFTKHSSVVENMRELSSITAGEIKDILNVDPILKPSTLKIEKGMSLKKMAERKPAAEGHKKFEKYILIELARASLLLAHFWDQAYIEAGSPAVKGYKSYQYPFTPDFVKPDYF